NAGPDWDPDLGPEATWKTQRSPGGGGIAQDDQGNTVIVSKDGAVVTLTPDGSSATTPDGRAFERDSASGGGADGGAKPSSAGGSDGSSRGGDDLSIDD